MRARSSLSGRSCGTTRSLMAATCLAALPLRTISPWQIRRHDALPDRPGSDGGDHTTRELPRGRQPPAIPRPPDVGRGFFCYCGRNPSDTSFIPRRSTAPGDAASSSTAVMEAVGRRAGAHEAWLWRQAAQAIWILDGLRRPPWPPT